jgi:hypothetical protein
MLSDLLKSFSLLLHIRQNIFQTNYVIEIISVELFDKISHRIIRVV